MNAEQANSSKGQTRRVADPGQVRLLLTCSHSCHKAFAELLAIARSKPTRVLQDILCTLL